MSRSLSIASVQSLLAQQTGEAYLVLLTIKSAAGSILARWTSDAVDTVVTDVSPNETHTPYPFDLSLPDNTEGRTPSATLTIDNVSRTLIEDIRTLADPLTVTMKVVLGSDPTDTLVEFPDYTLQGVSYNATSISGQLTLETFLQEQVGRIMTGSNYPGLFYT
jgi:hypothetical protein